jgi:hypothetical protein
MDVDAARKRNTTTLSCFRCGDPGHIAKECPRRFDVRYMLEEEREEWVQHLLVSKDVAEAQEKADESQHEVVEDFGADNE